MDPKVLLTVGAIMTAWVMLSLIGNERRRKVMEWQAANPPATQPANDQSKGQGDQGK